MTETAQASFGLHDQLLPIKHLALVLPMADANLIGVWLNRGYWTPSRPYKGRGVARLYSFADTLWIATLEFARRDHVPLAAGRKLAEKVVARAETLSLGGHDLAQIERRVFFTYSVVWGVRSGKPSRIHLEQRDLSAPDWGASGLHEHLLQVDRLIGESARRYAQALAEQAKEEEAEA